MGFMDLDLLFFNWDEINVKVLWVVDVVVELWGVKIICIEIKDINLLCDFVDVMVC